MAVSSQDSPATHPCPPRPLFLTPAPERTTILTPRTVAERRRCQKWDDMSDNDPDDGIPDVWDNNSRPSLVPWAVVGTRATSERAQAGRGRFSANRGRSREEPNRPGKFAAAEMELKEHFATETAASASSSTGTGTAARRSPRTSRSHDDLRPAKASKNCATSDNQGKEPETRQGRLAAQEMSPIRNIAFVRPTGAPASLSTANASARPSSASHTGDGPRDPSGSKAPRKTHEFFNDHRVVYIEGRDAAVVAPTRSELAADFATKRQDKGLDMISSAQFCFFPTEQPRYYNPGALPFCHIYNKPSGDGCSRDHYEDGDFPGVRMCGKPGETIRVHGCTWCGEAGHNAPRCHGHKLPDKDIQMTLHEFNQWKSGPKSSWENARRCDEYVHRTRDPDGRFRNA
jgi:hypothetical protein